MSFGAELSDIFDGLPGGRGPSLDAYMAHSDDDSSSDDELNAGAFVAWMKQKAEAARQERQQRLQVKKAAEKQSTVRKRTSKEKALESSESGRPATRQSRQGSLSLTGKPARKSSRKSRKSFEVSEIGGRKISLEVGETDSSDTFVEALSLSPLDPDAPEESTGTPLVGSTTLGQSIGSQPEASAPPAESSGTQLEELATPQQSLSSQPDGSSPPEESSGTQPEGSDTLPTPAQSTEVQSSPDSRVRILCPSYLEPNDHTTYSASTYVDTPVFQLDSASDDQGPGRNASRHASRSSLKSIDKTASSLVSRSRQGAEDSHTDSSDGDQNMEMETPDATVKESMQTAPLATASDKRTAAKMSGRKRKKSKVCMPRKSIPTVRKPKARDPSTGSKKDLHLTITPLPVKKSLKKKIQSPPKSHSSRLASLNKSPGSPRARSVLHMAKRVVLSPKSSAKMSRNQGGVNANVDALNFQQVSPEPSPVAVTPPTSSSAQRGLTPPHGKVTVSTNKASASSKKKVVSSVLSSVSPDSPLSASTARHESMKSMRENAISIIASITEDEARVEHTRPTINSPDEDEADPVPTPLSGRRQSDTSSVVSGYGLEQTPCSTHVVTIGKQSASEEDDGTTQSSKAARKKRRKGPALCYPSSKRPIKQKKEQAREGTAEKLSQLTESEGETGTESEDVGDVAPNEVTVISSRPVMLDGYTPMDKGVPLNRSQIVRTIGGHKYKYSPVKGRKGVTPGRRRTKRTKVPVLSDGERYAYTVDENVLQTVAGRVRPLEERNEKEQRHREKKPKSSIRRAPVPNCLDMAFAETQDQDESVASFPMQTADGDHLEVEFLRYLGACPKKTLSGSDAVKSDPVIICPMYANETCSVGCIFINAKCAKPQQVTAGASLVFILMSGMIEVEMRSGDQNYVKQIKPVARFWIPEDVTYSIQNVDRVAAELVYVRLRQR